MPVCVCVVGGRLKLEGSVVPVWGGKTGAHSPPCGGSAESNST